jgi:hypothetical protein
MRFSIGDHVQTIKGDRLSGIKKSGIVVGFGKWRDYKTLKIQTGEEFAKRRVSILEKNAILLKHGSRRCEDCKNYGMINMELGERCFVKGETEYPSGFKRFNGYVRAYPIPKERTCKNYSHNTRTTEDKNGDC